MENFNVGEGRFSLMIHGAELQEAELSQQLELPATSFIRKGEVLSRLPAITAQSDMWVHEIPLTEPGGADTALQSLLACLMAHQGVLKELSARHEVTLRLYVRSNKARFAYRLMAETMEKLTEIGLPLEISNLSWGELGL